MMIKLLAIGVWVCIVTLLSSYAAVVWKAPHAHSKEVEIPPDARTTIKLKMLSVPIIRDGEHQGYVVLQFEIIADAALAKRYAARSELVIADEAFKTVYAEDDIDFRKLHKQDLATLTRKIVENVNTRFGTHFAEEAFIDVLNYIPKNETRSGPKD
jgi:hypothetical protein